MHNININTIGIIHPCNDDLPIINNKKELAAIKNKSSPKYLKEVCFDNKNNLLHKSDIWKHNMYSTNGYRIK